MPPVLPPRVRQSINNPDSNIPPQGTIVSDSNKFTSNAACYNLPTHNQQTDVAALVSTQVRAAQNDNSYGNKPDCSNYQVVPLPDESPVVPPRVGRVSDTNWQTSSIGYLNSLATTSQVTPVSDIEQQASSFIPTNHDVPPVLPPRVKPSDQTCCLGLLTLVPSPIAVNDSLMAKVPLPRYHNSYLPPVVGCITSAQVSDLCAEFDPLCMQEAVQTNCENDADRVKVSTKARTMNRMHSQSVIESTNGDRNFARDDIQSQCTAENQEIVYEHLKWSSSSSVSK